jgi:hypothetical protein
MVFDTKKVTKTNTNIAFENICSEVEELEMEN